MRIISFALLMSVMLLSACGQKGPLYLPQDRDVPVVSDSDQTDADSHQKKQTSQ